MATQIPYSDIGRAAFEEIGDFTNSHLLSGSDPKLAPAVSMNLRKGTKVKRWEVLKLDGNNYLVPAKHGQGPARFVATQAVEAPAAKDVKVPCLYQGCFNPGALEWDASYTTLEQKKAAFLGATAPTQILVTPRI